MDPDRSAIRNRKCASNLEYVLKSAGGFGPEMVRKCADRRTSPGIWTGPWKSFQALISPLMRLWNHSARHSWGFENLACGAGIFWKKWPILWCARIRTKNSRLLTFAPCFGIFGKKRHFLHFWPKITFCSFFWKKCEKCAFLEGIEPGRRFRIYFFTFFHFWQKGCGKCAGLSWFRGRKTVLSKNSEK